MPTSSTPPIPPAAPSVAHSAARATGLTIVLVLVSRLLGVARDVVIGAQFGQNETTTIYTAAFRVPDLIALVIAGGALSSVFVPVFTQYWSTDREADAWRVFGAVVTVASLVIAVVVGAMEIFAGPLTALLNPRFGPVAVAQTADLTRILLPAQWCLLIGGLMNGTLYARKRFLTPALSPVLYNLGAILGGLLFAKSLGIASMAWGVLVGAILGSVFLPLWELARGGAVWNLGFGNVRHEGVRKVGALFLPSVLGLSLSQMIFWVTGFFLPEDFRLSALRNAYNLTQAPIGVFAQAFGIVLLPTISALAANEEWTAFRETLGTGLRRVLFLTVPASLIMSVLALPLIRVVLKRGLFTEENVQQTAVALVAYSVATFAWSAMSILARGFYAVQDTRTPVLITTPLVFVFAGLCWAISRAKPDGYVELAFAASGVAVVAMLLFVWRLQARIGDMDLSGIAVSAGKTFAAAGAASLLAWGVLRILGAWAGADGLRSAVVVVVAGGLAVAAYVVAASLLRMPELRGVLEMVRRPRNAPVNVPAEP